MIGHENEGASTKYLLLFQCHSNMAILNPSEIHRNQRSRSTPLHWNSRHSTIWYLCEIEVQK